MARDTEFSVIQDRISRRVSWNADNRTHCPVDATGGGRPGNNFAARAAHAASNREEEAGRISPFLIRAFKSRSGSILNPSESFVLGEAA
jgi:hypothetical protein